MSNGNDVRIIDLRKHIGLDPVTDEDLALDNVQIDQCKEVKIVDFQEQKVPQYYFKIKQHENILQFGLDVPEIKNFEEKEKSFMDRTSSRIDEFGIEDPATTFQIEMVVETRDNVAYWCTLSFESIQWERINL